MHYSGFPQALEIMENLENHYDNVEKSWNLKNHGILYNNLAKPPVAKKLSSQKTSCWSLVCPTASFLATGGFKF